MKTIYNLKFGLLALILFLGMTKANAQCAVTFTPTYNANGNVTFNSTSSPGPATSYYWGYYNGASWVNAGPNPSYTYGSNGTYTVTLFAMFGPSVAPTCSAAANVVITVTNALCPAGFNASYNYSVGTGNAVSFTSTSTGTTTSTTFLYKFGDGGTATTANANHTYASSGNYNATLILTDGSCVDSVTQMISVQPPCSLTANFTSTVGVNGQVNVTSTSTGTTASSYYTWNWGDASPSNQGTNLTSTGHLYASNNSYVIWLSVYNTSVIPTCSASTQQTITVNTATCNYNANFTYTNVGTSGQVNFSSTSAGTSASTIYKWNFNDGTGFFYGNPISHNFANGGAHNVMLLIKDSVSTTCVDSIIQQVNVTSFPCTANSNFTLMFSGTPQLWYASPAYFGNVLAAQWSWGDGTFSGNLFTSHTYSTAGMYNICLTVTTSCGTSSTCSNYNIFKTINADANNSMAMIQINVVPQMVTGVANAIQENASVSLFPNPNNGSFKLNIENVKSDNVNITIYNVLGQEVYNNSARVTNGNLRTDINADNLSNGTYYIKVKSDVKSYNLKTVINK